MIALEYTGTDGSVWDLRSGPVQLAGPIEGLLNPPQQVYSREAPGQHGQETTSWRYKARPVSMPLLLGVHATDPLSWLAVDRAWWAANEPGEYGRLRVTAPDGVSRTLHLRFEDDGGGSLPADPSLEAMYVVAMNYTADDPWYHGTDLSRSFSAGEEANFFGGPGGSGEGPPFYISAANTIASATFTNPGDVAAWPTYVIRGPALAFSSTIGDGTVSSSFTVPAGATLRIDTHPLVQLAILTDGDTVTNVTGELDQIGFRPVPAGQSVQLDLVLNGSGSITVLLSPLYRKAW